MGKIGFAISKTLSYTGKVISSNVRKVGVVLKWFSLWRLVGFGLLSGCVFLITAGLIYICQIQNSHDIVLGYLWIFTGVANIFNLIYGGIFND